VTHQPNEECFNQDVRLRDASWLRTTVLDWAPIHGRDFIWRHWSDPYKLLVAEILLKQTRAETVAQFIPKFVAQYPSAQKLAEAEIDELAGVLTPLGFNNQRAIHLRNLALLILPCDPGAFKSPAFLRSLPGIGPYAAGAVAASLGTPAPAVDSNIARLISRFFDLRPSESEPRKSHNIWQVASMIMEASSTPAKVMWGMLDLCALTCVSRVPKCATCPLKARCQYFRANIHKEPPQG
jgi:A/G-specific adenine glycosylase